MSYDLQAAVTSWVAQELELRAPGEDIGYWVSLDRASHGLEAILHLQTPEFSESRRIPVPIDEAHVRFNTSRAVDTLARHHTERDQAGPSRGGA